MIRFDKVYEKVQEDSKIKKHKTIRDFWQVFHDLSTKPVTQKQKTLEVEPIYSPRRSAKLIQI